MSSTQLVALSSLFSSGLVKELASTGRSPRFARIVEQAGLRDRLTMDAVTVADMFQAAFSQLRRAGFRDEYVYRSALTHNVLLGRHSLRTATMLSEFRAGESKADLVVLNGTATAYEIKSDRDSLSRLSTQLRDYRKVFAQVYVIAGSEHVESACETAPEDVGVLALTRWNRISTIRNATDCSDRVCPLAILDSLRIPEAQQILIGLGHEAVEAPNTQLRKVLRTKYSKLDPRSVHAEMVRVLKSSRNQSHLATLVKSLPSALRAAALSIPLRERDHGRLISAVETPFERVKSWT